ncbi:hypothetical protein pb186bvf_000437 [Paramecium bursaria]
MKANIFLLQEYIKQSRQFYEEIIHSNKKVLDQFQKIVDTTNDLYDSFINNQISNHKVYQMMILSNNQIEKIYENSKKQSDQITIQFQELKMLKLNDENKDLENRMMQISCFLQGQDEIFKDLFSNIQKVRQTLKHSNPIQFAVKSNNDKYLATVDSQNFVIVWNLQNLSQIANFSKKKQFTSVIFGQYSKKLYLGNKVGSLYQLDKIHQQLEISKYKICKSSITQLEQDLKQPSLIYFTSSDQKLGVFSFISKMITKSIDIQYKGIYNFIRSQQNKFIICPVQAKLTFIEDNNLNCLFCHQKILDSNYQVLLRLQHMKNETQFLFHNDNQNQFQVYQIDTQAKLFTQVIQIFCNNQILGFSWAVFDEAIVIEHRDQFFIKSNNNKFASNKTIKFQGNYQRKIFIQQSFLCDQLIYIDGENVFIIE